MSLLFRVLHANKCTSTHHKLAMDALLQLESPHAEQWQNLFVKNIELYLDGAKAPDKKFKDFRNHVLHVQDNYWGGAVVKSEEWYQRLCECLRQEDWARSVYAAGVLSHYMTDPFMPLHTAQSEAEGAVHRAAEWSVAKSYDSLVKSLTEELGGYPSLSLSHSDDWLALAIIAGAQQANGHYDTLIDHYNLERGVQDPPEGLDQECRDLIARLLGNATVTLARVFDRAFEVANATPPETNVTLAGYLTTAATPIFWITRKLADNQDKAAVRAIYREVQMKNRAIESLPEDEYTVRALHAEEVLGITEEELEDEQPRQTGTKFGSGTPSRTAVVEADPVDDVAATEEADGVAPSKSPTKFGQSAWQERRRQRQEAAAQRSEQQADQTSAESVTGTAESEPPTVVAETESETGVLTKVAAAGTAIAASFLKRRTTDADGVAAADVEEPAHPFAESPHQSRDEAESVPGRVQESAAVQQDELVDDYLAAAAEHSDVEAAPDEDEDESEDDTDFDAEESEYASSDHEIADVSDDEEEEDDSDEEESDEYEYEEESDEYEDEYEEEAAEYENETAEYEDDEEEAADDDEEDEPAEEEIEEHAEEEVEDDIEEPVVFERVQQPESRRPRFYLELANPVVDAPSIGGGTAKRLRKTGIRTVGDLLECDPELTAKATRASYITAESIAEWQNQSRLQCRVPGLRGHDAQILVACGLTDPHAIGRMTADELLAIVEPFANSTEGERILRSSEPPDRDEVANWIEWASLSRSLRAA